MGLCGVYLCKDRKTMTKISENVSRDASLLILKNSINNTIVSLKYLETPACRALLSKDSIINRRKELTVKFRTLLTIKESLDIHNI
jgi:hypothetical protein